MLLLLEQAVNLVLRVLGIVTGIQSVVNAISGNTEKAAQETTPFKIQTDAFNAEQTVDNVFYGNAAIKAAIDANQTAVLAAIAAIPPPITPPPFPTTFPPGWGAGTASSVWGSQLGVGMLPASQYLLWTAWNARFRSEIEEPIFSPQVDYPWVLLGDYTVDGQQDPEVGTTVTLDFSTILASDATSADWLFRVYPTTPWTTFTNGILGVADPGANTFFWGVWLPQDLWLELKASLGLGPGSAHDPPLWPGLAGVTLGTPVAIATGVTITSPMAGVLILLSSVPLGRGSYLFDDKHSYLNLGALTFFSDNGDEEHPQNFGFETELYLVKTMAVAAGVKVRAVPGLAGTITPFTIP